MESSSSVFPLSACIIAVSLLAWRVVDYFLMAFTTTPSHNVGLQEDSTSTADEFRSLVIPLGDQSRLESYVKLPTFDGLVVVREAWTMALSKTWNATKIHAVDQVYINSTIRVTEVFLGPRHLPFTPPTTPNTTHDSSLLKQTLIIYTISPTKETSVNSLQLPEHVKFRTSQCQIRVEVVQNACQWHMTLSYNPESVSQTQAEELVEHFQQEVEVAIHSVVSALPPSPPAEEVIKDFAEAVQLPNCPKIQRCIHDLVEEHVVARPQQEAICAHDGSFSYAELSILSSKLSHTLIYSGARPEQRVAILMSKSRWYPVAVLAALKAGAAFVPLDPNHPDTRVKQLVIEIEPCVIITSSSLLCKAQDLGCSNLLAIDQMSTFDGTKASLPAASANPDNAAYIIFTSGSTGKPKGVVVEHSALATSAVMRGAVLGLGPESRVLQYAPHTFDVSVDEILTTLMHGGCVCIPSESDRFAIAQFMEDKRVTAALLTPTSARTLNPDDVPTLRTLQTGGEVLTEDVNDKWCNRVTLFNVYGPTEASVACVISNRTGQHGTGHVLGRAVGGNCWVVDPDDLSQRMAPNEVGELVISGPILARGYFRDLVKTEASFVGLPGTEERIYKTGDLASMDATGTISYHGRKDLEIKIRGQRINIAEVEHAILQCDVAHSAVVEYPRSGPCANRLTAILCFEGESDTEVQQSAVDSFSGAQGICEDILTLLHSHVSSVLTAAMVPSRWLTLPHLPQTTSTKIDRKQVRTWLEEMDEDTHTRIFHSGAKNTRKKLMDSTPIPDGNLTAVWSQVLKLEPQHLRLDQSFIRNGGDSIMAMEARHLVHGAGLVIDIRDLLGGRSLHEISLMATSTSGSASVSSIEEDTEQPFVLSPVQQMYFDKIHDPTLGLQQRVRVDIMRPIQPDTMRIALNLLLKKHRMLGARFVRHEGSWMQYLPSVDTADEQSLYGLYSEAPVSLSDFCTEPMSIENGPLIHAHLEQTSGDRQTLVLCAHHLVVDFVSWRVILQDLHDALIAAQGGTYPQSRTRSTLTFQQWCREQNRYAASLVPDIVLPFPLGPVDLTFWQPVGSATLSNTYAEVVQYESRLSSTQTAQLLDKFSSLPSIHPTDVMIGAFAVAFQRIFPERDTPNIFIEGHGREPWQHSLDVTHTVGWFTAAYPIHLPGEALSALSGAIRAASERRRATPANGHSYWTCRYLSAKGREAFAHDQRHQQMEVVFNYAGTVVQRAPDHGLFGDNVRTAEVGHPDCERFSLLDIGASIEQPHQELVITYSFPKNFKHKNRIHELLQTHKKLLVCATEAEMDGQPSTPAYSCPADIARLLKEQTINLDRDVETVYAASSIQQHMLHRQRMEPWYYRVRGTWTVERTTELSSPVDLDRLARAWWEVVHRHSTLRTAFQYSDDQQQFIAIVLRNVSPSIVRVQASDEVDSRSLCRDAETMVPPHRMVLQEMSDGSVECQLEFSHVIIDAASRSIVLRDLADAYEGTLQRRPLQSPSFWEYINLTQSSANYSTPCPALSRAMAPAGPVASLPVEFTCPNTSFSKACMAYEITISSFFMTAWTIVLSQKLDSESVAFDYVLSDRFVNIPGIETAVGLYIRLPACQLMVTRGVPMAELTRQVHAQRTCVPQTGLRLPSESAATQGFATLVNIRNSGTESLDMTSGKVQWNLKCFEDPWDYDLVLAVNMRGPRVLGCSIDYAEGVVSTSVAFGFAEDLSKVVEAMMQEMVQKRGEPNCVERGKFCLDSCM